MTNCQRCEGKGCPLCSPLKGDVLKGKTRIPRCGNAKTATVNGSCYRSFVGFEYASAKWATWMTRKEWRKWASTATIVKAVPRG